MSTLTLKLTPTYNIARNNQHFAGAEGVDHDGVEIEPLTEHPEKITHREILTQDMKGLTPALERKRKQ